MKYAVAIFCFLAIFSQSFAQSGKTVWTKGGHTSAVKHLYFDSEEKLVSSGGAMPARPYSYGGFINDPSIYTWDIYSENITESYYSGTKSYYFQSSQIEWNSQEIQLMRATNSLVAGSYEQMSFSAFSTQQNEYFIGTHIYVFDRLSSALRDSIFIKQDSNVAFALHPFKNEIAFRSGASEITVRDMATKQTIRTIQQNNILAMQYSPDGSLLAVSTLNEGIVLWKLENGLKYLYYNHNKPISLLHFFEKSKYLFAVDTSGEILLCNTGNFIYSKEPTGHTAAVTGIATSGSSYALSSLDSTVSVWSMDDATIRNEIRFKTGVTSVAFKNDGQTLAVGLDNGDIEIMDISGGNRRNLSSFKGNAEEVRLFPDNSKILIQYKNLLDRSGEIAVFDRTTGNTVDHILSKDNYWGKLISPDLRFVIVRKNNSVFVAETENQTSLRYITKSNSSIPGLTNMSIAISPDSRILATSGVGEIWTNFWKVETGELLGRIPKRMNITPQNSFSQDGSLFVSGDTSAIESNVGTALWKVSDFTLYKSFPIEFNKVKLSPNNKYITFQALPFEYWKTQIWDVESGSMIHEIIAELIHLLLKYEISPIVLLT